MNSGEFHFRTEQSELVVQHSRLEQRQQKHWQERPHFVDKILRLLDRKPNSCSQLLAVAWPASDVSYRKLVCLA